MNELAVRTMDDIERAATAMSKSGYFADSRDAAQAIVKILAGQEMGFGPFASMTGVYIIQGRPSISASLMAAAVKRSGRYNYRVVELTDARCVIDFYEGKDKIGTSTFTAEDARKAGTKNLDKYPRNMLFARAMSNGVRFHCPDVFNGSATYTPEELGASVNEDGNVIDIPANVIQDVKENTPVRVVEQTAPEPEPADVTVSEMSWETAREYRTKENQPYIDIDTPTLSHMANSLNRGLAGHKYEGDKIVEAQQKLAAIRCILAKRDAAPLNVK